MKICFITSNIFTHGGVARVLTTIANELSKYYEVDIICTSKDINIENNIYGLDFRNVNIIHQEIRVSLLNKIIKKIFTNIKQIDNEKVDKLILKNIVPKKVRKQFINLINERQYDYVIGVHGFYTLLVASISEKIRSYKIGWQHNSFEAYFNTRNTYYWGMNSVFKNNINKLDVNIVLTEHDKKKYDTISPNSNNIAIYNPLSFTTKIKSNCNNKKFISVGRLTKQKGYDLLINAFYLFSKDNTDWTLDIVGEGEEEKTLSELIEKLKLKDRIRINPFSTKIESFYLNSSVYISASRWEGFGLVLIEAMECGLPIISFENSGPREIIENNINGILVERNNVRELANSMVYLANNQYIINKLSKKAQERARNFSINYIGERWRNILNSVEGEYGTTKMDR